MASDIYRRRWDIEIFFRWIKKNLRIKAFYGTSFNAVCIQIWTAISAYVLIAIVKKRLEIDMELYKILQIVSINPFQKVPLSQLLTDMANKNAATINHNQLMLFDL